MAMANPSKVIPVYAPSHSTSYRLGAWFIGHATVLIVIYTMIKVTVLLLASARLQDQEISPVVPVIKGCSTNIVGGADATDTTVPCDPSTTPVTPDATTSKKDFELHTFFGVNLVYTGVSFYQAILIFIIISLFNVPQLYAGLKLVEATDLKRCARKSISLAFVYQRIQFIVVAVELLFLGMILYSGGNDFLGTNGKGCYIFYAGMLGIFSKLVFLFTVGLFVDERLKSLSKYKRITVIKSSNKPCTSHRIPVNILDKGEVIKIQMPELAPAVDQTKVENV